MTDQPTYAPRPHWPGIYAGDDHFLRLNVWNAVAGVTVTLAGAVGNDDGCVHPFVYTLIPTSDGLINTKSFPLEKGIVLWAEAFVSAGTPIAAQTYCRCEIVQGSATAQQPLATLIAGYLTPNSARAYPNDVVQRSVDGRGTWRSVAGTVPAPGADFSDTVPANRRWLLVGVAFQLVTDATAPVRTMILTIDDGANVLWETSQNGTIAATLTTKFRAGAGVPNFGPTANMFQIPLPETLLLPAGSRIRSVTTAKGAGDQFSAIFYNVEEWFDV